MESAESLLRRLIAAWESLPGNQRYAPHEIERWLRNEMHPAVQAARDFLKRQGD